MKKIVILLLSIFILSSLTSCRLTDEVKHISSIHDDVDTYIDKSNVYVEEQWKLLDTYDQKFVNEVNPDQAYIVLTEEIIPDFEAFSEKMKDIQYETVEVNNVHLTFVKGIDTHIKALYEYKKAYDEKDETYYDTGDAFIEEANALYEESNNELMKLAEEYRIPLKME